MQFSCHPYCGGMTVHNLQRKKHSLKGQILAWGNAPQEVVEPRTVMSPELVLWHTPVDPKPRQSPGIYTFQRLPHMLLIISESGALVPQHPTDREETLIMAYKWLLSVLNCNLLKITLVIFIPGFKASCSLLYITYLIVLFCLVKLSILIFFFYGWIANVNVYISI